MSSAKSIAAEIEKLDRQKELLVSKLHELQELPVRYRLANVLHELDCRTNHEDGCDWEYSSWKQSGEHYSSRKRYAEWADRILGSCGVNNEVATLQLMEMVLERKYD